jgi:hypothetical protein
MVYMRCTNCGAVLKDHGVSVSVLLRFARATGWLVRESGRVPVWEEVEWDNHREGDGKGHAAAELGRSYIVVQAEDDLQVSSRRAALGELDLENLEDAMAVAVRPSRTRFDTWGTSRLVTILGRGRCSMYDICFGGRGSRLCSRCGGTDGNRLGSRFIYVDRYRGVFPYGEVAWFTGVTDAVDAVRDVYCGVKTWLQVEKGNRPLRWGEVGLFPLGRGCSRV